MGKMSNIIGVATICAATGFIGFMARDVVRLHSHAQSLPQAKREAAAQQEIREPDVSVVLSLGDYQTPQPSEPFTYRSRPVFSHPEPQVVYVQEPAPPAPQCNRLADQYIQQEIIESMARERYIDQRWLDSLDRHLNY